MRAFGAKCSRNRATSLGGCEQSSGGRGGVLRGRGGALLWRCLHRAVLKRKTLYRDRLLLHSTPKGHITVRNRGDGRRLRRNDSLASEVRVLTAVEVDLFALGHVEGRLELDEEFDDALGDAVLYRIHVVIWMREHARGEDGGEVGDVHTRCKAVGSEDSEEIEEIEEEKLVGDREGRDQILEGRDARIDVRERLVWSGG